MINWYVETISPAEGELWGLLALQPDDLDQYDQLAPRFRRGGCKNLTPREYYGVMWAQTTCTVTVQTLDGVPHVTELHTGASRIIPTADLGVPPLFAEAIGRGRMLLALLAPGTLPTYGTDRPLPAETREHVGEQMEQAIAQPGRVLGGFARVLDQPAPLPGAARPLRR